MEMSQVLGVAINLTDQVESQVAGGGQCFVYPSPIAIEYVLRDPHLSKEYRWQGPVLFALGQKFVLLGHHRCLEKFNITFYGPERRLELAPRFHASKK